ncbi:hypothetical protein BUY37_01780 [Staphylococcus cohnii]|uniref:hypothetical protein n=1 Tax=Staphylococcus cohnii species complex TaxID=3239053 RepID=UPI000E697D8D|nr:hypothetical protein [Staphylococcus cohnii]RIL77133.1 hypothetical protein BUY37_01780 [Staphylococcus cohnii]
MNHKRIAHQILARLPTHVNNVSVRYIDSLVRQYARNKKDFSVIKRIINQKRKKAFNYGKNSTRQYNQYL